MRSAMPRERRSGSGNPCGCVSGRS
jgi:hypothetical protein